MRSGQCAVAIVCSRPLPVAASQWCGVTNLVAGEWRRRSAERIRERPPTNDQSPSQRSRPFTQHPAQHSGTAAHCHLPGEMDRCTPLHYTPSDEDDVTTVEQWRRTLLLDRRDPPERLSHPLSDHRAGHLIRSGRAWRQWEHTVGCIFLAILRLLLRADDAATLNATLSDPTPAESELIRHQRLHLSSHALCFGSPCRLSHSATSLLQTVD